MSALLEFLGYRRRWQILGQLGAPYVSETAPVVIGGCGSSGTTLLRRMLDRHPAISCGPESTVFLERMTGVHELGPRMGIAPEEIAEWQRASRSQAEFIDRFQAACLARAGKTVWADKTPENVRRFSFARRHFPRAWLVHVIRDGRDVACSLRRQPWMKSRHREASDAVARCAAYWVDRVTVGRAMRSDPRYVKIRYEDLVADPAAALRRLLEFLGLDWSDRLLHAERATDDPAAGPAFTTSVGRWRRDLTEREIETIDGIAGPLLAELGYGASTAPASRTNAAR